MKENNMKEAVSLNVCITVFTLLLAACTGSPSTQGSLRLGILNVTGGKVSGVPTDTEGVTVFRGIPYAAPPVGELRWRAPAAVIPWDGVKVCDTDGNVPRQDADASNYMAGRFPESEDCLYLNVYTPAKHQGEKLPVIVYIYGGGFVQNASSLFDGEAMAAKGVIMVIINYRLGVFGFLAHPELTAESEIHSSGNYGILDQIAALKWVRGNIDAFGGDPDTVTLCGQSAGAVSIGVLAVSPLAKGLFHRIILESGTGLGAAGTSPLSFSTLAESEALGVQFMQSKGAANLEELRKMYPKTVGTGLSNYWPNIDGVVLPGTVLDIFAQGNQNDVTVLLGSNREELGPAQVTASSFADQLKNEFGAFANKALKVYPSASDEQAMASVILKNADTFFGWPMFRLAELTAARNSDVYHYYFTRVPPGKSYCLHSYDVVYLNMLLIDWREQWVDIDRKLSNTMISYWANFARTGNPNGAGLPQWDKFNTDRTKTMELGVNIGMIDNPRLNAMEFLTRFYTR
jgi:para-nitrobenzyl esterase